MPEDSSANVAPQPGLTARRSLRFALAVLAVILAVGTVLRFSQLTHAPPGLYQDEAANAWNANCLRQTGKDQAGVSWPIFYSRCLGGNRSTLYIYALIPFQQLFGMNVWTTRAPAALGGVVTILLIYLLGTRLFDRRIGCIAAALLALNPWHIQLSRFGHEASLVPLLVVLPMVLWLWAGFPVSNASTQRLRVWPAMLAGLVTGLCCYGYPPVRLFLPLFLLLSTLIAWPRWKSILIDRRSLIGVGAFCTGLLLTLGPLVWKHVSDPAGIGKRGQATWVWGAAETTGERVLSVLSRYPGHFGPEFLFQEGDRYVVCSVPGYGQFHWYMLPLLLVGLFHLVRQARSSGVARVLLLWVLLYPIGDCFNIHVSMHALRSAPGLCGLIVVGAVGANGCYQFLRKTHWLRPSYLAIGTIAIAAAFNVTFLRAWFVRYPKTPIIFHAYHTDLVAAIHWLAGELPSVDAVYFTTQGMNLPYIVTLVLLNHDPHDWFSQERVFRTPGEWDVYERYGKMRFLYGQSIEAELEEFRDNGRPDRLIFVVRPGELGLADPIRVISGPQKLWICEVRL